MASSAQLGDRLEAYVTDLVKTGRYQSRSEVLREGVRLVEEREKRLAALDLALTRGLAEAEEGRTLSLDTAFEMLAAELEKPAGVGPA